MLLLAVAYQSVIHIFEPNNTRKNKSKKKQNIVCTTYEDEMPGKTWVAVHYGSLLGGTCCYSMLYWGILKEGGLITIYLFRYFRRFGIGKIPIPNSFFYEFRYRIPIPDFRYVPFGSVSVSITGHRTTAQ